MNGLFMKLHLRSAADWRLAQFCQGAQALGQINARLGFSKATLWIQAAAKGVFKRAGISKTRSAGSAGLNFLKRQGSNVPVSR